MKASATAVNRKGTESAQKRGEGRVFEGGDSQRSNNPRRIRDRYRNLAAGKPSKAFLKSFLKVKGHGI